MSAQEIPSPIGTLRLVADRRKLRGITLLREPPRCAEGNEITRRAAEQLDEYFAGKREQFSIAALPHGTAFQRAVWSAMARIPYGAVATYGQLAAAIGHPSACRAVANAVGKNPLLIVLPCHRVVAARGLGGFSAGLAAKRALLQREGVEIPEKSGICQKYFFTFP